MICDHLVDLGWRWMIVDERFVTFDLGLGCTRGWFFNPSDWLITISRAQAWYLGSGYPMLSTDIWCASGGHWGPCFIIPGSSWSPTWIIVVQQFWASCWQIWKVLGWFDTNQCANKKDRHTPTLDTNTHKGYSSETTKTNEQTLKQYSEMRLSPQEWNNLPIPFWKSLSWLLGGHNKDYIIRTCIYSMSTYLHIFTEMYEYIFILCKNIHCPELAYSCKCYECKHPSWLLNMWHGLLTNVDPFNGSWSLVLIHCDPHVQLSPWHRALGTGTGALMLGSFPRSSQYKRAGLGKATRSSPWMAPVVVAVVMTRVAGWWACDSCILVYLSAGYWWRYMKITRLQTYPAMLTTIVSECRASPWLATGLPDTSRLPEIHQGTGSAEDSAHERHPTCAASPRQVQPWRMMENDGKNGNWWWTKLIMLKKMSWSMATGMNSYALIMIYDWWLLMIEDRLL